VQCVILAGGLGTRISAVANGVPKHLVPVLGTPFADLQLRWLSTQGVTEVTYCIAHLGDAIRSYVGDGSRWGLTVHYVDEGSERRGTGGALALAAEMDALQERFLVVYGDSFLQVDVGAFWAAFEVSDFPAAMTVFHNRGRFGPDNVLLEPGQPVRYDKHPDQELRAQMEHIDYGLSALTRSIIEERIPVGARVDLADVFAEISRDGLLGGFVVSDRFYEVGTPESLQDLEDHLRVAGSRAR
jgi:NDP-sugar pyrophosphorylase family protein